MDEVFDLIGIDWTFVRLDWRHVELKRMARRGWVEVRERARYRLVRLTAAGRVERDRRDKRRATELNKAKHGSRR